MAGESILVVDDNPTNLKLTSFLLQSEGYTVRTARDGAEALEEVARKRPDLILMDVQLPGTDGLDIARQLKSAPDTQSIRIVALTAYAMESDRLKALEAGCDGYIAKPIDTRTFAAQLRPFLDSSDSPGSA